jgi:hypothetical protein
MANRKALVVAINDYPGEANDLPSCVEDAKGVTELLQSEPYGFQEVRHCLDGEATIKTVTAGLHWLFGKSSQGEGAQVTPEDRLVFYYSGHGFRTEKEGVLRECLCLYDGFFFDEELNKQTQGLPPGVFTMILDSCHSGGMDKRFFETLSSDGGGAEESVERVRVKTWMPAPEELVKLFSTEEESIPFKPFGCATIKPRRTPQAGAKKYTGAATKVKQAKESAEAQVNGLMITACQADQTAAASSSQTQGNSAFTFCLLNAFKKSGNGLPNLDSLSSDKLFEAVTQDLAALQFKQTPALIEPPNSPGLRSRSFLTLQPISQAPAGASPAAPSPDAATSAAGQGGQSSPTNPTTNQGEQPMNTTASTYPMTDTDEKMLRAVLPAVLPSLLQYRMKDFQSEAAGMATGQTPEADEKFWGQVIAAAITAAPGVINAVRGKDFQADAAGVAPPQTPVVDEKMMHLLPAILPGILQAYRSKGFQAGDSSSAGGTATSQAPVTDEKFWGAVVAAAISAAPSIYQAVRGKDAQPGYEYSGRE